MRLYINNKECPFEIQSFNEDGFTEYPSHALLLYFISDINNPINECFKGKITDIILKDNSTIVGELHDIDAQIARVDEELINEQVKVLVTIHFNI